MQDRFKFRAYNFLSKKYTYFDEPEVQFAERNSVYLCGLIMPLLDEKQSLYFGKYELQQCTGLKDKNGKLIYEGDIVQVLDDEIPYIIEYEQDRAMFVIHSEIDRVCCNFDNYSGSELEIIGNIYENPELIGGAE